MPHEGVDQENFCGAASPRVSAIAARFWRSPQASDARKRTAVTRSVAILFCAESGVNPALSDSAVGARCAAHRRLPYKGKRCAYAPLANGSRRSEDLPRRLAFLLSSVGSTLMLGCSHGSSH
jgi:hypothetical protein